MLGYRMENFTNEARVFKEKYIFEDFLIDFQSGCGPQYDNYKSILTEWLM